MLSQYSWGDLFKVILALAIPYYAFVIIKYYREDIREWINNRGSKPAPSTEPEEIQEDDDDVDVYSTKTYTAPVKAQAEPTRQQAEPVTPAAPAFSNLPDGPAVPEESSVLFDIDGVGEVVRPKERSLASILNAAGRLRADADGVLAAEDPSDDDASDLAGIVNDQRGLSSVLSGVSFNR